MVHKTAQLLMTLNQLMQSSHNAKCHDSYNDSPRIAVNSFCIVTRLHQLFKVACIHVDFVFFSLFLVLILCLLHAYIVMCLSI